MTKPLYIIWELHNKAEPRLCLFYLNKEKAEKRLEQLKDRNPIHDYYIIESEVIE